MNNIEKVISNNPEIRSYFLNKKHKRKGLFSYIKESIYSRSSLFKKKTNYMQYIVSIIYISVFSFLLTLITSSPLKNIDIFFLTTISTAFSALPLLIIYNESLYDEDEDNGHFQFIFLNVSIVILSSYFFAVESEKIQIALGVLASIMFIFKFKPVFAFIIKFPNRLYNFINNYLRNENYKDLSQSIKKNDHLFLTEHLTEDEMISFLESYPTYKDLPLEYMKQMDELDVKGLKEEDRKAVIKEYTQSLYNAKSK